MSYEIFKAIYLHKIRRQTVYNRLTLVAHTSELKKFVIKRMQLIENKLYHFYNQGNNKDDIFFSRENYLYFLKNFRKFVLPYCDVLSYCLMPNHFHFLINTNKESLVEKKVGGLILTALNNGFRQFLSVYAQAINKQEGRSGSLFRQKTKA